MEQPSTSKRARVDSSDDSDNFKIEMESDVDFDLQSDEETYILEASSNLHKRKKKPNPDHENPNINWRDTHTPAKNIQFTGKPGIKIEFSSNDPILFFDAIANSEFYDFMTTEINNGAIEYIMQSTVKKNTAMELKDVSVEEFKKWLGILLHMGTIRLNRTAKYWKSHNLFNITGITQHMTHKRFNFILRMLNFNHDPKRFDCFDKIRPLINFFNSRMNEIYEPKKNLYIDESFLLWRGKFMFQHKMVDNRFVSGIKMCTLTELDGLAMQIALFRGRRLRKKYYGNSVVNKLMEKMNGVGRSVYMDSYFSSVLLTDSLLRKNTYVTGFMEKHRLFNPEGVVQKELQIGESVSQYGDNGLCVTKYKNEDEEVLAISSEFDGNLTETTNYFGKSVMEPKMMAEYKKRVDGANCDYKDQLLSYYSCELIFIPWQQKLAIHIFQMMLLNAFYLYRLHTKENISLYDFRLAIIEKLIGPVAKPSVSSTFDIHLPKFLDEENLKKRKRRDCKYCFNNFRVKKSSMFVCFECPDTPTFCLQPCFRLYHKYIRDCQEGEEEETNQINPDS